MSPFRVWSRYVMPLAQRNAFVFITAKPDEKADDIAVNFRFERSQTMPVVESHFIQVEISHRCSKLADSNWSEMFKLLNTLQVAATSNNSAFFFGVGRQEFCFTVSPCCMRRSFHFWTSCSRPACYEMVSKYHLHKALCRALDVDVACYSIHNNNKEDWWEAASLMKPWWKHETVLIYLKHFELYYSDRDGAIWPNACVSLAVGFAERKPSVDPEIQCRLDEAFHDHFPWVTARRVLRQ